MSVLPEAMGGTTAEQTGEIVLPEAMATSSDSPPEAPEAETAAPAPVAEKTETLQDEKGPVPYTRFDEVNRAKKDLEAQLQPLAQLKQLYDLASTDPRQAAMGFKTVAEALEKIAPKALEEDPDESLMTDTELKLHRKVQALEGRLSSVAQTTQAAQQRVADRETSDALKATEAWAKEKGLPFDEDRVRESMDGLDIEGLMRKGKSVEDIAKMAYKADYFDEVPNTVKKQTYEAQLKKAGATLGPATSKGGQERVQVNSVRDALNMAWSKLGLPE